MSAKLSLVISSDQTVVTSPTIELVSFDNATNHISIQIPDLYDDVKMIKCIPDDNLLAQIYRVLKPSGKLLIDGVEDRSLGQALSLDLKIQGFLNIMAAKDSSSGERFIVCGKPSWELGSAAALKISSTSASTENKTKWKMAVTDLAENDIIDENELLKESVIPNKASGCGEEGTENKKRACKNCTCGLAEIEAKGDDAMKASNEEKSKSACGNCYKGDAFRCASCPHLGKPAFEPGQERLVLTMDSDL